LGSGESECKLCVYDGENSSTERSFSLQFISKDTSFPVDIAESSEMVLSFVVYPQQITARNFPYLKRTREVEGGPEVENNQKRPKPADVKSSSSDYSLIRY